MSPMPIPHILFLCVCLHQVAGQSIIAIVGTNGNNGQTCDPSAKTCTVQSDNFGFDKSASWPATASCTGKLYISGGASKQHASLQAIIIWDKATNQTVPTHFEMTKPRQYHSMECDSTGANLIICGGKQDGAYLNDCETCSLSSYSCASKTTLSAHRYSQVSVVYQTDTELLMGGFDDDGVFMNTVFSNTLGGATWSSETSMPVSRAYFGAAALDANTVLVCGGKDNDDTYVSCFTFDGSTWTQVSSMTFGRAYFGMVNFNGKIYALGDYTKTSIETYTAAAGAWNPETMALANPTFTYTAKTL